MAKKLTELINVDGEILVGVKPPKPPKKILGGFYVLTVANDGIPTRKGDRHPHFTNEQLYKAHVQRFAYLPSGKPEHLFAITFTDGLFSTTADNLNNWNQE